MIFRLTIYEEKATEYMKGYSTQIHNASYLTSILILVRDANNTCREYQQTHHLRPTTQLTPEHSCVSILGPVFPQ